MSAPGTAGSGKPKPAPDSDSSASAKTRRQIDDAGRLSNAQLIVRLLGLAWRFKRRALAIIGLQLVLLAMALTGLGLTGLGIDVVHHAVEPDLDKPIPWPFGLEPPADWAPIAKVMAIAAAIFLIAAARFFLDRTNTVQTARLVQDIVVHLRSLVYDKLQRLSFRFFDANESGSIINRVTGDVQAVRMFIDGVLVQVLMMVISLSFFLAYMLSIHVWLTVACLATTPIMAVITVVFSRIVRPAYRRNRELYDKAVLTLSENAQGVHVVKGFSLQAWEEQKFAQANNEVSEQQRWIFKVVSTFVPLIMLLPQINLMILLVYGGYLYIHDDSLTLGSGLLVFAGLLQQFSSQIGGIAGVANMVQRSLTGAQRVFEVLDEPVEIASPSNPKPIGRSRGAVAFEHVSFAYRAGQQPALEDIDFRVEPGQTVAILGATGAGKSTLLSLIPRFYDPTAGRVTLDGIDLRELDLDELRRNIGIVFQESFLFSDTVAQNIAFGHPNASQEQIEKAARIAQAHQFIMEDLTNGYESVLSESGGNLSGGQRQRLAIARAVLLEPPILLLDDPTAAIDPETENEILEAMNRAMEGRTTFVVAHRLSTLRRADLVVVLDDGRVVQAGTHHDLINQRGHYQHAAQLQIADDESRRLLGIEGGGA